MAIDCSRDALPAFAGQLTAGDRHRIGAISWKALRRGVSHTDWYWRNHQ